MQKYGIDNLRVMIEIVANTMSSVDKLLHKGGLAATIGLVQHLSALLKVEFTALKQEIGELSEDERHELLQVYAANLSLTDGTLQKKFISASSALEDAIDIVERIVALVNKVKLIMV